MLVLEVPSCMEPGLDEKESWWGRCRALIKHPWRLFFKMFFWIINIISGGAHLQGPENGLHRWFPGWTGATLDAVAIPFKISDATGHVAVSILGSNAMVDGIARAMKTKESSFWHRDATILQRIGFTVLTIFLVVTAEVSSTYRNWQNNAGLAISMRIFWVGFYLASHIPEVIYSTLLLVQDYFNGPKISTPTQQLIRTRTIARLNFNLSHNLISNLNAYSDLDRIITWTGRCFGVLLVIPTYIVKGMSSVDGFLVLTNQEVTSWILGICGMLAEAYLEFVFTHQLVEQLLTILCYRWQRIPRAVTADPFYTVFPKTTLVCMTVGLSFGVLTLPGSYNSAYGVLPSSWNQIKVAICWIYAIRYIFQAALGIQLVLQHTIQAIIRHFNPTYHQLLKDVHTIRKHPTHPTHPLDEEMALI